MSFAERSELRKVLQHAGRLVGSTRPDQVLAHTCEEALRVSGAALVCCSYAATAQHWQQREHVMLGPEPRDVPAPIVSALFSLHRRLAAERRPLRLTRSDDTRAIFEAISAELPSAANTIYAVPLLHRTGRTVGEIALASAAHDAFEAASTQLLPELAALASLALEGTQRLAFARRDQERLQLLAEASDEALWDWNLDTGELWWGGGIQKLLGSGKLAAHGSAAWKFDRIHRDDVGRVKHSLERAIAALSTSSWKQTYRFTRADGSDLVVEDSGYFLREASGRAYRVVGTMRDVTPLEALLEGEKRARSEAEKANRAKDEFLAMLGHELRNPLAPILTAVELLGLRGSAEVERERIIIDRQARHLVRLVDDLLDVSRVATGKIKLKKRRVELVEAVSKAIEMAAPMMDERAHRLHVEVPASGLVVMADPPRLAQVISNLLTNAAKYTPPSGDIRIVAEPAGDQVSLSVIDSGIGIAPEMLPQVFDLFTQERQALDRSQGGLGLGLSIVRSLTELHGGRVDASSAGRGRGSCFTIRLPLADAPAETASPAPSGEDDEKAPAPRANTLRILVVDDNEEAAELLAEYLNLHLGHSTRVAHDGAAALRAADEMSPDVVLLDIGLPVMDGYEVARRLREQQKRERLRLIAVTGYGQERDRRQAKEASFDAHLVKPVSVTQLAQTIADLTSAPAHS